MDLARELEEIAAELGHPIRVLDAPIRLGFALDSPSVTYPVVAKRWGLLWPVGQLHVEFSHEGVVPESFTYWCTPDLLPALTKLAALHAGSIPSTPVPVRSEAWRIFTATHLYLRGVDAPERPCSTIAVGHE